MSTLGDLYHHDRVPLLGALREETVEFIAQHASHASIKAGEVIFSEGATGESLYLIESGRVEIFHPDTGEQNAVAIFSTGDCFGEMALIDCQPRSASAVALEPTELCVISGNTLFELYRFDIEQFAVLQMNISREVIRRLRQAANRPTQVPVSVPLKQGR